MGMKRQPYMKKGLIIYCPTISNVMQHAQFWALGKCLDVTNLVINIREKSLPGYDKLVQTRWLIDKI